MRAQGGRSEASSKLAALEAFAAAGGHVKELEERESLTGWAWVWEAFNDLSSCRAIGFGVGPIPWTATARWADEYDLGQAERYELFFLIREMDVVFVKHYAQKSELKKKKR